MLWHKLDLAVQLHNVKSFLPKSGVFQSE